MHEKAIDFREAKILSGTNDPILRDYLRTSGSPLVTSYRGGSNGLLYSKEARQAPKRRRVNPMVFIHRLIYGISVASLATIVAVIWG